MPPILKVSIGPNVDELKEITYNDDSSHAVRSPNFDGFVSIHIKGEEGVANSGSNTYFAHESRSTRTWSIRIQGRFLKEINGNDLLFGNVFDRPLTLPWGFGAALNFVQYMDPTLEHDLYGDKPWALSPLLSTMPYLQRTQLAANKPVPSIPSTLLTEDKFEPPLASALEKDSTPATRRKHFTDEANRKEIALTPKVRFYVINFVAVNSYVMVSKDLISADCCHGYLQFPGLMLILPGGMEFDLMSYYDERPVHFVCKERGTDGTIFFVVSFIVLKDGEEEEDDNNVAPVDSSDID
ncbi:hypothetical protein FRC07_005937 [Ceratobasidium sp. 392]|nr:hypothetical protein FRC07_005937 [Ceratobasidium sp. 392]